MNKSCGFLALFISVFMLACNGNISQSTNEISQSDSVPSAERPDGCISEGAVTQSQSFLASIGNPQNDWDNFPDDVKCFTENAAICEHFAGEEGYDEERQKYILQALNKTCIPAQELSVILKKKYAHNAIIEKVLTVCDPGMPTACSSFKK